VLFGVVEILVIMLFEQRKEDSNDEKFQEF